MFADTVLVLLLFWLFITLMSVSAAATLYYSPHWLLRLSNIVIPFVTLPVLVLVITYRYIRGDLV